MNTTLPPARDLPPHRHARIRATLVHAASEPRTRRWKAPAFSVATAVVAVGLVMWLVPLGDDDGRAAGQATTSAAASPNVDESTVRRVRFSKEDVPVLVQSCVDSAGVEGTFELKLAFADAAGQLAVLYGGDKLIACEFGDPAGGYRSTFTVLGGYQPPISMDLNLVTTVEGSPDRMGYQVAIGRVDPATVARVTLTQGDVTIDAVLVDGVYAARIVRPVDWWLTGDNPPPVVDAYNAEGDLVGSASAPGAGG
ncbi:hypothetical protein [Actinophytocola sediminis]